MTNLRYSMVKISIYTKPKLPSTGDEGVKFLHKPWHYRNDIFKGGVIQILHTFQVIYFKLKEWEKYIFHFGHGALVYQLKFEMFYGRHELLQDSGLM